MIRIDKVFASVANYAIPVPSLSLVSSDFDYSLEIANEKVVEGRRVRRVYRAHLGALAIPYPLVLVNNEPVRGDREGYVRLELSRLGRYTVRFGLSKDVFEISNFEQEHYLVTESATLTELGKNPISGVRRAKHVVGGVGISFEVRIRSREAEVRGARMHLELVVERVAQMPWPTYVFARIGRSYYEPIKEVRKRIYGYPGERVTIDTDLPPFKGPINAYLWIAYWDGESFVVYGWEELKLEKGYIKMRNIVWPAVSFYRNPEWGMRYMFIAHFPVHLYENIYEFPEVVIPIRVWGIKPDDTSKVIEIPYELYKGLEIAPSDKAFFDGKPISNKGVLKIVV